MLPVVNVSYEDAVEFAKWRSKRDGVTYRLPTEEEWEAAARGQSAKKYPWGDTITAGQANTASAGRPGPDEVGSYPRSATVLGAQDMIGNVWEWTSSAPTAYPGARPQPESMQQFRVIRGGAFGTADTIATAWYRGYNRPATSPADLEQTGFRCAMSPRTSSGAR